MNLPRAEAALETCELHLSSTGTYHTEVDAILASYASAVIYSAFESQARAIVAARASQPGDDPHLVSFTRTAATRLMRSIKVSELAGAAALFDASCKERFHAALDDETKAAWDTICSNRHGLAHEEGDESDTIVSNLTFAELRTLYPKALPVLDRLSEAIIRPVQPGSQPAPTAVVANTPGWRRRFASLRRRHDQL
jgi:hypothetical protein